MSFFIHSSIHEHLHCFIILVIWIRLKWTCGCIYLFKLMFLFSLGKYPEVELLDHRVILFLIYRGNSTLSPIVTVQFIFPSTVHKCSLFSISSPTPVICCLFYNSHSQVWGDISLWFWFTSPWWLVMLRIFSCICWPSVSPLENVHSDPLPFSNQDVCYFFFDVELLEFFVYFWYYIRYIWTDIQTEKQ